VHAPSFTKLDLYKSSPVPRPCTRADPPFADPAKTAGDVEAVVLGIGRSPPGAGDARSSGRPTPRCRRAVDRRHRRDVPTRARRTASAAGSTPAAWAPREFRRGVVPVLSDGGSPTQGHRDRRGHSGASSPRGVTATSSGRSCSTGATAVDRIFASATTPTRTRPAGHPAARRGHIRGWVWPPSWWVTPGSDQ
jgi:hypothetical protein